MEFTKIKIEDKYFPKRFYRILAIKGDPDLYTLGAIIGESVQAWFEHMYLFNTKGKSFIPDMWMDDTWIGNCAPMSVSHLSDLGDKFRFEYDTGESYDFECTVYKRKFKTNDPIYEDACGFVIEGKGQGIFENDHYSLNCYLDGRINPKSCKEDEEYRLPMNMKFSCYGDFDKELDLNHFIWNNLEIEEITKQFREDYNAPIDLDDELDETEIMIPMLLNQIAGDIFNNEFMNTIFRKLIKTHDINEAYEMIVDVAIELLSKDMNEEQFDKEFKKRLKLLH